MLRPAQVAPAPAWSRQAYAVLAATVAHNVEELLTVRPSLTQPPVDGLLQRWNVTPQRAWSAFQRLNWAVSAAAAAATVAGSSRNRPVLPAVVASTMLVNVAIPHVPAAVQARGYAPGLLTSVFVVLPTSSRYLLHCRRHGLISPRGLRACLLGGVALVVLGVPGGLFVADRLGHRPDGEVLQ